MKISSIFVAFLENMNFTVDISKVDFSQNFVTFSEYTNFQLFWDSYSYENTRKTWDTDFIIVCQNLIGLYLWI